MKPTFLFLLLTSVLTAQEPAPPPEQVAKAVPAEASPPAPPMDAPSLPAPKPPAAKPADGKAKADDESPVPVPPLDHYAKLWTDSLFTTRALPMPEAPSGPSFVDGYTLSGTFEDNGKMTAVLIDRATSGVVMAYIGQDNEAGFRISKIDLGDSPDKMRIQLQKGNQVGWVSFADAGAPPPSVPDPNNAVLGSRPGAGNPAAASGMAPGFNGVPAPGVPATRPGGPIQGARRAIPAADAVPAIPAATPVPAAAPIDSGVRAGLPAVAPAVPGDPPLPPQ